MYNSGAADTSDFFALEILDGYLFLLLDLGSGTTKVKVTQGMVSDGLQHLVLLDHNGKIGKRTDRFFVFIKRSLFCCFCSSQSNLNFSSQTLERSWW